MICTISGVLGLGEQVHNARGDGATPLFRRYGRLVFALWWA